MTSPTSRRSGGDALALRVGAGARAGGRARRSGLVGAGAGDISMVNTSTYRSAPNSIAGVFKKWSNVLYADSYIVRACNNAGCSQFSAVATQY